MLRIKGKSVVIIGGSGFIGTHLAERLSNEGASVTIADRMPPFNFSGRFKKRIDFKKIDIVNLKQLKKLLLKQKYVFNLAASLPFSTRQSDYLKESLDINLNGAVNIVSACKAAGVKKLVFTSAYLVYGVPEYLPINENHPTNPIDLYGMSKLAAEIFLKAISRKSPLELVILRLSTVYGPRQTSKGLIPNLIRASLNGSTISIYAKGKQKRDYLFINDAINALTLTLSDGVNGVFNVGSNRSVSVNQVKDIIESLSKKRIKVKYLNKKSAIDDVLLSNKLAKSRFHYQPKINITNGLTQTYFWHKNHLNCTGE